MAEKYIARRISNPNDLPPVADINDFAFFHSSRYEKITGKKKYQRKSKDSDLYVAIANGKKKIYLKYHSANVTKDYLLLSYSNLCRLGVNGAEDINVEVRESNSFWFSWFNINSATRIGFRIAVYSVSVSILSIILTVLSHFCQ